MKTDAETIYHYSPFENDPYGHGGCKRTNQLIEIAQKNGFVVQSLALETAVPKGLGQLLNNFCLGVYYVLALKLPFLPTLKGLIKIGFYSRISQRALRPIPAKSIIIVEDFCRLGAILSVFAQKKNLKLIGSIHNVEALVPGFRSTFSNSTGRKYLTEELFFIRKCNITFAISREENWLLNLNGIKSIYLPYFPSKKVYDELEEVSRTAGPARNGRAFVLGTVLNPPTEQGMLELIDVLESKRIPTDVAGFGTEVFRSKRPKLEFVTIHGGISFDDMRNFLRRNQWLVVNQPFTSGVLTRIIEALLAGISVVGSTSALRSYHFLPGVHECDFADFELPQSHSEIDIRPYLQTLSQGEVIFKSVLNNREC